MEDLKKMFEPVTANSKAVKRIRELDSVPWAIKYIGRRLNSECKTHFNLKDDQGFKIELPWEGQERHVEHNFYDDSTYIHELVVDVHSEGPAKGRIKSVHAHHWDHWHTTSNWQDHSESYSSEVRSPNEQEIQQYQRLLDQWTEGGSDEQIEALESCLERIALSQNGMVRVNCRCDHTFGRRLIVSFINGCGASHYAEIDVSIDSLKEALDLSHVRIEALFSPQFRKKRGAGLKTKGGQCPGDEGILLQYFLNLFDFSSSPELYPYLEDAKQAWLCDLFEECESYRLFMNQDPAIWWRDVWWRLPQLMSVESRQSENMKRLQSYYRSNNTRKMLTDDPLKELIGKVKVTLGTQRQNTTSLMPDDGRSLLRLLDMFFKPDRDKRLFYLAKDEHYHDVNVSEHAEFYFEVANGVYWAYCLCTLDSHDTFDDGCNVVHHDNVFAVIDINKAEPTVDTSVTEVVVPSCIGGYRVAAILSLNDKWPKSWKSLVIDGNGDKIKIGPGAFKGWTQLESVIFKKEADVASSAFEECCSLREVVFGFGASALASRSFFECNTLSALDVDIRGNSISDVDLIGELSFGGCKDLKSVKIKSASDLTIGNSAFNGCVGLESVDICCCGKASIGPSAFQGCTALKCVELKDCSPNKVKEEQEVSILGAKCFYGCESLKSVLLPSMVKIVEREAFSGTYGRIPRIHHDGDVFWFEGFDALVWCEVHHWNWGRIVRYGDNEEMPLSSLLEKLDIPRAKYIELALKHGDSFKKIIEIILRKRSLQSSDRASYDS